MPISFNNIPADLKIPLYWVEVDPSQAGIPMIHQPSLLVGTMLASGNAIPNVAIAIGTQSQADAHFGIGSEMSRLFKTFFANVDEITATPDLPVTATAATNIVTLHAVWKGVTGNDIRVDLNYYGTIGGESLPVGLGIQLPAGAAQTATGTGTGAGTNLTVATVSGEIQLGS